MKINTLDHNILIDIKHKNECGKFIYSKIVESSDSFNIVNIGASELRLGGIRPDRYDLFEAFLNDIGLAHLNRLNPLARIDVTFIGRSNICSEEDDNLYQKIKKLLFPNGFDPGVNLIEQPPYKPIERKKINQICDAVALWCHVKHHTESFVTRDKNFHKKSNQLTNLCGANIVHPDQLA